MHESLKSVKLQMQKNRLGVTLYSLS